MSPFHVIYSKAYNWPSDQTISSRSLIALVNPQPLPPPKDFFRTYMVLLFCAKLCLLFDFCFVFQTRIS